MMLLSDQASTVIANCKWILTNAVQKKSLLIGKLILCDVFSLRLEISLWISQVTTLVSSNQVTDPAAVGFVSGANRRSKNTSFKLAYQPLLPLSWCSLSVIHCPLFLPIVVWASKSAVFCTKTLAELASKSGRPLSYCQQNKSSLPERAVLWAYAILLLCVLCIKCLLQL